MDAAHSASPRFRVRFTVTQLMLAIAVVAIVLWGFRQPFLRYQEELRALKILQGFSGYAGRGTDGVTYARIGNVPHYNYVANDRLWATQRFTWTDGLASPLTQLHLDGTKLTDKELDSVGRLTELVGLWLDDTNITDDGLAHVRNLRRLHRLYLNNTKITDHGLQHLTGLKNLAELRIQNTKITDAGVDVLRKELPRCEIVR